MGDARTFDQGVFDHINEVHKTVLQTVSKQPTPTATNIGRRLLDHLEDAALNLAHLGNYYDTLPATTEAAAEQAVAGGKVHAFPGK